VGLNALDVNRRAYALYRRASALADLNPINGNETALKITVQGTSAETVSLNALKLVVDKRDKPTGIAVGQCGRASPTRHFYDADLDSPSTTLVPKASSEPGAAPTPVFSFNVTSSDAPHIRMLTSKMPRGNNNSKEWPSLPLVTASGCNAWTR
jgi:hypothetical protein